MADTDTLHRLLNASFKPAPDDIVIKNKETFSIDIFLKLPEEFPAQKFINVGIVCIGRYELIGNGKDKVAKHIENNLDIIVQSFRWIDILDDIQDRRMLMNLIFVLDGAQYFVDEHKEGGSGGYTVEKRDNKYLVATRVHKVTIPGKGDGLLMLSTESWAVSDMGIGMKFTITEEYSDWWFPAIDWVNVDGVRNTVEAHSQTYIAQADGVDSVMVPDTFESDVGILTIRTPVYIKKDDGSQLNYVCGFTWYIMQVMTDSRQDRELLSSDVWMSVETADGRTLKMVFDEPGVTCRVDYWKGKALRVMYFQGDHPFLIQKADTHTLELGYQFPDGDRIKGFYLSRPDEVNRPSAITAFTKDFEATLYSSDIYDIIITKQDLTGVVKEFKVFNLDGSEVTLPAYKFAIIGDHSGNPNGIKRMKTMDISSASAFHKELDSVAKTKPKDVIIDDLTLNDRDGPFHTGKQIDGDKILRKITVDEFDRNLTAVDFTLETDIDTQMRSNGMPHALSVRFTVPDKKRLDEIMSDYKNIAKQLEQKAKTRSEEAAKWRSGKIYETLNKDVGKAFGLVANDGISGDTMINTEDLKHNNKIKLKGAF